MNKSLFNFNFEGRSGDLGKCHEIIDFWKFLLVKLGRDFGKCELGKHLKGLSA